ncbi:hypothetical protein TNCV_4085451 [Trichonephila clavipes]|nr:hypothetical protein TNCV_4085451 [Trichonephila clavipes]
MNPLLLNSSDFYDDLNSSAARLDNWTSCQQQNNLSSCNETFVVDDVSSQTLYAGKVYWALVMIPLPLVAVVGNILVILSVYKERNLQSATNYFIVSLAFADLLVAAVVMPFAVYVLLKQQMPWCHSVHDLKLAVQDLWAHLPQDNIRCLINSMPDYVAACIAAGGGPTRY